MSVLSFISDADFKKRIELTIKQYGKKLKPYNLKKLNSNLVDPIKLIFHKVVYRYSWEKIIKRKFSVSTNEIDFTGMEEASKWGAQILIYGLERRRNLLKGYFDFITNEAAHLAELPPMQRLYLLSGREETL